MKSQLPSAASGLRVRRLASRVWGLGFGGVWGFGFRVWRIRVWVWGLGFGFRVWGLVALIRVQSTQQLSTYLG